MDLLSMLTAPNEGKLTKLINPLYPLDEDEINNAGALMTMSHSTEKEFFSEKTVILGGVPTAPSVKYTNLRKLRDASRANFKEATEKAIGHAFETANYPTINLTKMTCDLLIEAAKEGKSEIVVKTHCCAVKTCPQILFCEAMAKTWMEHE